MTNATLNNLQRVGLHFNVFARRIRFLIVPLSGYYFDEQLKLQVMHQNTEKNRQIERAFLLEPIKRQYCSYEYGVGWVEEQYLKEYIVLSSLLCRLYYIIYYTYMV